MGYKRRVVKLIGWRIAWEGGTFNHFATTVMKFGWKNAGLNKGIEDRNRCLIRTAGFKSEFEWKSQFIILIIRYPSQDGRIKPSVKLFEEVANIKVNYYGRCTSP